MNSIKLLVISFIFLSIVSGCKNKEKNSAEQHIKVSLDTYSEEKHFSGTVLIAKDGKILFESGYGMADYENKISNSTNTVFKIGSITKQFTAMSILILEQEEKLNVDDPINKYLPDYPNGEKITIHNLLTHTSGIAEYTIEENMKVDSLKKQYSPEDIIKLFIDKPLTFEPGTKFEYCNSNYILLGYIIEKTSNMTFKEFLKKNIFEILDMENTDFESNEILKEKAIGYAFGTIENLNPVEDIYMDITFPYSAGAMQSTVGDLYKWEQALYTEKLVNNTELEKMFKDYGLRYGFGWFITSPNVAEHNGNIYGFNTYIYRDTNSKTTIIILANESGNTSQYMKNYILKILSE